MTQLHGHADAVAAFIAAADGGAIHHAWLLAGPQGVGKATFARAAALRLLAGATDPSSIAAGRLDVGGDTMAARLFAAGTHPDYRELRRLPRDADKPGQDLARSIPIAQVRALLPMLATTPSLSRRRVVVIDSADDLERPGASNALLKSLEEPPAGTIFFLVSHAPGRLLPTIRSRCRLLRFGALAERDVAAVLRDALPDAGTDEIDALARVADGSPGRAIGYAGLDLGALDAALERIAREGDAGNEERSKLSRALGLKAAQPRYEAFLERVPTVIAATAAQRRGEPLRAALDAYAEARAIAGAARGLSLDPAATVFELAGVVARLAEAEGAR